MSDFDELVENFLEYDSVGSGLDDAGKAAFREHIKLYETEIMKIQSAREEIPIITKKNFSTAQIMAMEGSRRTAAIDIPYFFIYMNVGLGTRY